MVWSEKMDHDNGDVNDVTHTGTIPKKQRTDIANIPTQNLFTPVSKLADVVEVIKDSLW